MKNALDGDLNHDGLVDFANLPLLIIAQEGSQGVDSTASRETPQ
jgi:hypothetical protein